MDAKNGNKARNGWEAVGSVRVNAGAIEMIATHPTYMDEVRDFLQGKGSHLPVVNEGIELADGHYRIEARFESKRIAAIRILSL